MMPGNGSAQTPQLSPLARLQRTVQIPLVRSIVIVGCVALLAPPVLAQPRDPVTAEWLFRAGRALMKTGDFVTACAKLEESLRLDPAVGTSMNLAECEEKLGRTASAWQRWGAAADQLPTRDKRRAVALAHARALEKVIPRLTISVSPDAPSTLQVERDGVVLGKASLGAPLPVDPGRHSIVVTAPGHHPREIDLIIAASEHRSLTVEPGATHLPGAAGATHLQATAGATHLPGHSAVTPAAFIGSVPATSPRPTPALAVVEAKPVSPPPRRSLLPYALVGAGAAALTAGGYFALSAVRAREDAAAACVDVEGRRSCWNNAAGAVARDKRLSFAADASFVAAAALSGAGIYLLVKRRGHAPVTARVAPVVSGGQVELASPF
jgi:hypothetical protein